MAAALSSQKSADEFFQRMAADNLSDASSKAVPQATGAQTLTEERLLEETGAQRQSGETTAIHEAHVSPRTATNTPWFAHVVASVQSIGDRRAEGAIAERAAGGLAQALLDSADLEASVQINLQPCKLCIQTINLDCNIFSLFWQNHRLLSLKPSAQTETKV